MKTPKSMRLHFVGIGGIGMSGIAEILHRQGFHVTGSDLAESETTERLRGLGIVISVGHRAENIGDAQVLVISSAIKPENPEVQFARAQGVPIIPRAEMLAELMRGKTGVAVAGTHGKTTTTSMIGQILTEARFDPTLVIGGKVNALGGNAKSGDSEWVVAEADESDGSFLHLTPTYAVLTNIDNDHLDHFGSQTAVDRAFVQFAQKVPFYGQVALCVDDPGIRRVIGQIQKPKVTYGFSEDAAIRAVNPKVEGRGSRYELFREQIKLGEIVLEVPGRHNILNSLAAVALALELGIEFSIIQKALREFRGAGRRFEIRYESTFQNRLIVDDYAHHPTEIVATLSAAQAIWPGRILVVFQPHRYSRTLLCEREFLHAFDLAHRVWVTDLYAAGEPSIDGVSSQNLVKKILGRKPPSLSIEASGTLSETVQKVLSEFRDGDLLITLGAGNITTFASLIKARLG